MPDIKYAIVIPAKNEEENLANTLNAVAKQTVKPQVCLVVDDGSDDQTYQIANQFNQQYPFIQCIQRDNQGAYVLGGHVVKVFEYGRAHLDANKVEYDYIVKLDADLSFAEDFVEQIFNKIDDGKWAVFSGTPYRLEAGKTLYEYSPEWHSQGQFKFYNREFLQEINGIPKSLGWDCADNIIAIDRNWKTAAFRDVHYQMYRQVGGKSSLAKGRIKHGLGCYVLGYSPLYFFMRVAHDLIKPPFIIGSFSMLRGYFTAMLERRPKILSKQQQQLLRKLLWQTLRGRLRNRDFELLQKINAS